MKLNVFQYLGILLSANLLFSCQNTPAQTQPPTQTQTPTNIYDPIIYFERSAFSYQLSAFGLPIIDHSFSKAQIMTFSIRSRVWRSPSGKTRLPNLGKICRGGTSVNAVQTIFGYTNDDKYAVLGIINIKLPSQSGCKTGDTFEGNFDLGNHIYNCLGKVSISWLPNDRAKIKWNITNLGTSCPVSQRDWSIETYPEENK